MRKTRLFNMANAHGIAMRRVRFPKRLAGLLLGALLGTFLSYAPCRADHQPVENTFQNWDMVTLRAPLTPSRKLQMYLEAQPRVGNDFTQLLVRPAVVYQLNEHVSLWQGYAWTPVLQPNMVHEHRLFQQVQFEGKYKKLNLSNRYRVEERKIENVDGTSVRARSQVRATYPLTRSGNWSVVAYDEIFVNLNTLDGGPHAGFDQNRAFLGINHKLGSRANAELGYLNQYANRRQAPDRQNHIILLTLNFNLL